MKILSGNLEDAGRVSDAQGYNTSLSKCVECGNRYRLIMKLTKNANGAVTVPAVAVGARSLDFDTFNASLLVEGDGQIEVTENNKLIDLCGLDEWSAICRVLHEASAEREKKNKKAEAERLAADTGQPIDQLALQREIDAIDLDYFGGKAANGEKINPNKYPIMSDLMVKTVCQCAVIKLDASGVPDLDNVTIATFSMNKKKRQQIKNLITNKDYCNPDKGYIEVGYDYIGANKKQAGQNASFQGIAESLSISAQFKDAWDRTQSGILDRLYTDPEQIMAKDRNLNSEKTPKDVITGIKKYAANNPAVVANIVLDSDTTRYNVEKILNAGIADKIPKVKASLEEILEEVKSERGTVTETPEAEKVPEATVSEGRKEEAVAQAMSMIMNNNTDGTMDTFDDITGDLSDLDDIPDIE